MKIFFCIFILFILLLAELYIGTCGSYLPLTWMGYFYFFEADYVKKFLFPLGLTGVLLVDLLLFHRLFMPDFFIFAWIVYIGYKYRDFWRSSVVKGSFFAPLLLIAAYIFQFACSLLQTGFSLERLSADAAFMTLLLPIVFLLQMLLIKVLDFLQMKMRLEASFINIHSEPHRKIYRRHGGGNG